MVNYQVAWNDSSVGKVALAAFPKNRKPVTVREFSTPKNVDSYWDEGSRNEFALVDLVSLRSLGLPKNHPAFSQNGSLELRELPENTALVEGGYFRGKPSSIRVYLRPDNLVRLLPSPVELSDREAMALAVVSATVSSYRQDEFARRSLGDYSPSNSLIVSLADKGLVKINKAGGVSITIDGRNAVRWP